MAKRDYLQNLMRDLESHTEVRRFGSGWLSGFFALLFAISGFFMVVALRFPDWFATPELEVVKGWTGFRGAVHLVLLARSEEHTSELQSLMRISYAVFFLKKKK